MAASPAFLAPQQERPCLSTRSEQISEASQFLGQRCPCNIGRRFKPRTGYRLPLSRSDLNKLSREGFEYSVIDRDLNITAKIGGDFCIVCQGGSAGCNGRTCKCLCIGVVTERLH